MACSLCMQANKLAESSRMLEEEEAARLATSALYKRDLVLSLRKVHLLTAAAATSMCCLSPAVTTIYLIPGTMLMRQTLCQHDKLSTSM